MLLTKAFGKPPHLRWTVLATPVATLATMIVSTSVTPAEADPLPYGPETCIDGFVWRAARPGDAVCVTPDMRTTIAQQNADPGANKDPNGAYGPQSCAQGYVWRQAFDGDVVCVTPDFRAQVLADNAASPSRKAANSPGNQTTNQSGMLTFEVTGSGDLCGIVTDPATPYVRAYQVVVTTKSGAQGCRITLNGKVVAQQPIGNSPHCIYTP